MKFQVELTVGAQEDLRRLFDFIIDRELTREDGDLELAQEALTAIQQGLELLGRFPFTCRKASSSPFLRELVIPFASTGYVALFEIVDDANVLVAAIRHQREEDYH